MDLRVYVERSLNVTHAQQYQTFWNLTTNMTYSLSTPFITYQWSLLPFNIIDILSFPNFVEVQYFYTPGMIRPTTNDSWIVDATSIDNERYFNTGGF